MKVITLDSPLKIGIKNIPMPERKTDNEVLIKVRALGICGSEAERKDDGTERTMEQKERMDER